jgi:hypothetical protein
MPNSRTRGAGVGGDRAREVLEAAAASQAQREDVRAAVTELLTMMKGRN